MNGAVFTGQMHVLPGSQLSLTNSIKALETTQTTENIAHLPHSFFISPLMEGMSNWLPVHRARQLYKNISMLFLFPATRDLLFTNI